MGGLGLLVVKAAVEFAARIEFLMVATGDDVPGIEDEDTVSVLNGAETVGDGEDGATFGERFKGRLYLMLAFRIEGGGGFIKDNDGGIFEKGAGDCDALTLSARETGAAFADKGIVSVIEGFNEFVGVGEAGGLTDGVVVGLRISDADVIGNGVTKE